MRKQYFNILSLLSSIIISIILFLTFIKNYQYFIFVPLLIIFFYFVFNYFYRYYKPSEEYIFEHL